MTINRILLKMDSRDNSAMKISYPALKSVDGFFAFTFFSATVAVSPKNDVSENKPRRCADQFNTWRGEITVRNARQ